MRPSEVSSLHRSVVLGEKARRMASCEYPGLRTRLVLYVCGREGLLGAQGHASMTRVHAARLRCVAWAVCSAGRRIAPCADLRGKGMK